MVMSQVALTVGVMAGVLAMVVTASAQGITDMKKGEGGSVVQGSAGPSGSRPITRASGSRRSGSRST